MNEENMKSLHKLSSKHRVHVENAREVGCFCCCQLFDPETIKEWTDEKQTAICPLCGVDAVIYSTALFPLDRDLLMSMYTYWFAAITI